MYREETSVHHLGSVTGALESDVRPPKRLRLMVDMENSNGLANYDVFISHRGPDTKTGFVSFLYKDLVAAGLQPFLDCKSVDMGEDAWECIEHAIEKSPIAVVIFSENFAQSEWCLRELHVMLRTPGVNVLPIFYNVRPSEVRFPESGRLKDGFEKLNRRHDKAVIEQWRADLEQASKLIGWEHLGAQRRLEGDLVTEVVGKVFELANKPLRLDVGEYVVGVKQVAEEIIQTLNKKKKVLMLGLWGMGGIGKSTLARELYNQLSKNFDSRCYVEDVTEKVNQGGVVKVQHRILKDLCKNESVHVEGKFKGKSILEERLHRRRILIVLDDVRDNDEMDYWISRKMLSQGSMCIVTSRDRRVFEKSNAFDMNHEIHIHSVQLLSSADSRRVFTSYSFGGFWKVKPRFEKLVENISKACGGVPLVLKVCGALLKEEENVDIWEEVKKKLNCGTIMDERKIFECLRLSYDNLEPDYQDMFLDIACALLGRSKDLAICVWKSLNWSPAMGVRTLMEKALITVDDNGNFGMHDHLRDMGREIVRKGKASGGVITHLWMPESLALLKGNEPLPDSLQTLTLLDNYDYTFRSCSDTSNDTMDIDVSHMKDLRILICNKTINKRFLLPKNLRWFNQEKCEHPFAEMETFPIVPQNNELVIMKLEGCNIHNLPESFGELSNLEVLNLSDCENLTMLPDSFGGLRTMRHLYIRNSGIERLPESFGQLSNLEVLNLSDCENFTMLPDSFGGLKNMRNLMLCRSGIERLPKFFGELSNLKVLDLRSCKNLTMIPGSFGSLRTMRNLYLWNSAIERLPESFGNLNNLEVLDLSECKSLTLLPDSFGGLRTMRNLYLWNSGIEKLPTSFGELINLEVLDLSLSEDLTMLPNSFGGLRSVRYLQLQFCGIERLPESFGLLSKLEVLNLSDCENLTMLPDSFGCLRNMRNLMLCRSGIERLPESFGDLNNLEVLDLSECKNLTLLPDSFGGLRTIRNLYLWNSGIEKLPESFGELSNLEVLDLSECKNLTLLPDSFGGLRTIRNLYLWNSGIEKLPESFGELSNLEVLDLSSCKKLTMLPDSFGGLRTMRDLKIKGCGIERLPESFGELSNLEVLKDLSMYREFVRVLIVLPNAFMGFFKNCRELDLSYFRITSLPESFGQLVNLEVLNLSTCCKLMLLPDSFGSLRNLRTLQLDCCGVESLPMSFGDLSSLEWLDMTQCQKLITLPESFGRLRNLKHLNLRCSAELVSLPSAFGDLNNLRELNLWLCEKLIMLPDSFGSLGNLRTLTLGGNRMGSLPESFGKLSNLQELDLYCCWGLQALPQFFTQLRNLQMLDLQDCPASPSFRSFWHLMPGDCEVKL